MTLPLTARVEALAGGDREVDWLLHELAWGVFLRERGYARSGEGYVTENAEMRAMGAAYVRGPDAYTASLDAALGLVERVVPDAYPVIARNVTSPKAPSVKAWSVELFFPHRKGDAPMVETTAATPALALLAALLRSLEADAGEDNHGS